MQSWCRVTGRRAAGASLATVGFRARRRRWEAESHGVPAADGSCQDSCRLILSGL